MGANGVDKEQKQITIECINVYATGARIEESHPQSLAVVHLHETGVPSRSTMKLSTLSDGIYTARTVVSKSLGIPERPDLLTLLSSSPYT